MGRVYKTIPDFIAKSQIRHGIQKRNFGEREGLKGMGVGQIGRRKQII